MQRFILGTVRYGSSYQRHYVTSNAWGTGSKHFKVNTFTFSKLVCETRARKDEKDLAWYVYRWCHQLYACGSAADLRLPASTFERNPTRTRVALSTETIASLSAPARLRARPLCPV
ncbi:unnamed protein product [Ixodes persulcatus]